MVAQCELGNCYYNGYGISKNYKEAVRWYRKSAEQEYNWAQYYLGNCYYKGHGIKQDYDEAAKWHIKATNQ